MAELPEEAKMAAVLAFAEFKNSGFVVAMIKHDFGIEIEHRQAMGYNPEKTCYEAGEKWKVIFETRRKAYLEEVESIPISSQAFRLNELNKNYLKAAEAGNLVLANSILEQAAKEVGGVLTNERNLKVDKTSSLAELTPEERRNMATEMLREALGQASEQTAPTTHTTQ